MTLHLDFSSIVSTCSLQISGSKSETNRLLLLQAMFPQLEIENESDSDDSMVMAKAINSDDAVVDVGHAGTAMRFLTAYFATLPGREVMLTGSERMQQRPIGILVDALRQLGASISYLSREGFPPILIKGQKLSGGKVSLQANVSSQYISALILVGSKLSDGLQIELIGEITSVPYIQMTLSLLNQIGVKASFSDKTIAVEPLAQIQRKSIVVESDWSSASYFYSLIALSEPGTQITLSSFRENSYQGDSALAAIYTSLGVHTVFEEDTISLIKSPEPVNSHIGLNLNATPDIAQTIAVTCFGLGLSCELTGLHTLTIKETDRLKALDTELTKLGAAVSITKDSIAIGASHKINRNIAIETYHDHRMAMAFAPLAIKVPIIIKDSEVVSKSYSTFWNDLSVLGCAIKPES